GGGVVVVMGRWGVEVEDGEVGGAGGDGRAGVADPYDVDVVSVDGKLGGHNRRAAGRESVHELPLCPPDPVDRVDELEMRRPDVGDDADLRTGNLAQRSDLPETAHRKLEDADL